METPKRDVRMEDNLYKPATKKAGKGKFSKAIRLLTRGWLDGKFKIDL